MIKVFLQFRLALRQVVRRREHDRIRSRVGAPAGDVHRFDERRVGDGHEHWHTTFHLPTRALDKFLPQPVTEARPFARRAKDE